MHESPYVLDGLLEQQTVQPQRAYAADLGACEPLRDIHPEYVRAPAAE